MERWRHIARGYASPEGATAVEYAILAAGIAAVIVGSAIALGVTTGDLFASVPAF